MKSRCGNRRYTLICETTLGICHARPKNREDDVLLCGEFHIIDTTAANSYSSDDGALSGLEGALHHIATTYVTHHHVRVGRAAPCLRTERNFYTPFDAGWSWLFGSGMVPLGSVITVWWWWRCVAKLNVLSTLATE